MNSGPKKAHKTVSKNWRHLHHVAFKNSESGINNLLVVIFGTQKGRKLVVIYFFACIWIRSIDTSKLELIVYLLVTWSGDPKRSKNNCKKCYCLDLKIWTFSRSKITINYSSVIATDTRKGPWIGLESLESALTVH